MEKINGKITSVMKQEGEGKVSKKPFTRWVFIIDDKKYSTFDAKIGDTFKAGQEVEMEGEQDGAFWNMKTMKLLAETEKVDSVTPKSNNGFTTMYVSYAKDTFLGLLNLETAKGIEPAGVMKLAIDLVKQAKEAFS